MNLCATFPVTIDGTEIILKPLTVRQRLAFGNTLVERERQKSLEAGKAAGLTGRDLPISSRSPRVGPSACRSSWRPASRSRAR